MRKKERKYLLTEEELELILEDQAILCRLLEAGVEEWEFFDTALKDKETLFGTLEGEVKFLMTSYTPHN